MKKRLMLVLLAAVMIVSSVACSKKTNSGYEKADGNVTLTYYFPSQVYQYTDQVEEKLNEILQGIDGYEHITLDLVPTSSDYQRDLTLAQASGEQIDLVVTKDINFNTRVKNGDFIALDDLLEQFPEVVSEMPDWVVDYGKVHGAQYMIPTYQQAANLGYIAIPEEYLDMYLKAYDMTKEKVADIITRGTMDDQLDFVEDLCLAVRDATGLDTKWINIGETWGKNLISASFFNQEYINNAFDHWILREGAEGPEYFGYTEDYKKLMKRYAEWYQEGLLHPECTTVNYHKLVGNYFLEDESYVFQYVTDTCSEEYLAEYLTDKVPMVTFRVTDSVYIPSEWEAGGHAIYVDCEHPVEAMMILELLRTEKGKEFYNTLVYGLEGIHWQWDDKDEDRIITLEYDTVNGNSNCSYTATKWGNGNVFNAWKNQAVLPGFYEWVLENVNESDKAAKSPAMGITWDFSEVENQVLQCRAVESEFAYNIFISEDWEARYDKYIEKLEAAGVQDVLEALQKQYDEHLKSK